MTYEPTIWASGDVVTAAKLNKLENGVAASSGGGGVQVIDTSTLTKPTYNGVEIDSLFVSIDDEMTNLIDDSRVVFVGDAPENALIYKHDEVYDDVEYTAYALVYQEYDLSVNGLATSEGENYCITNDVTIHALECSSKIYYFIPPTAIIAPYFAETFR